MYFYSAKTIFTFSLKIFFFKGYTCPRLTPVLLKLTKFIKITILAFMLAPAKGLHNGWI